MTASIGDWYDNVSGRRNGGFGRDAENDDPVDRTPDKWLDDLHAPPIPERRRAPRARPSQPPGGPTPGARGGGPAVRRSGGGVTHAELERAALAISVHHPGITNKAMTRLLRYELGWPSLTSTRVAETLERHDGPSLAKEARAVMAAYPGIQPKKIAARLRQRGWSNISTESVQAALRNHTAASSVDRSAVRASKAAMSASAMARRIRTIDASAPGWTIPALTKKIREYGWPGATEADVSKALLGPSGPDVAASPSGRQTASGKDRTSNPVRRKTDARVGGSARPVVASRNKTMVTPARNQATPHRRSVPARGRHGAADRDARVRTILADVRGGIRTDPLQLQITMMIFERTAPSADIARLHRLLHRCGWTGLGRAHAEMLAEEFAVDAAASSSTVLADIDCHHATLTAAVRAMRAAVPGVSATKIALRLREWGWPGMATAQVQKVLAMLRTPVVQLPPRKAVRGARKPAGVVTPRPVPVATPNMVGPRRTLDIQERPNVNTCPGCGRTISSLGICGCS